MRCETMNHLRRAALLLLALAIAALFPACGEKDTTDFQEKAELLRQEALADWVRQELGDAPAGEPGYAAFLSVCDGATRASVYSASGETLDAAWDAVVSKTDAALKKSGLAPTWLKADLVYLSGNFTAQELEDALAYSETGFFYYGAAFDPNFETALLEAELNAASIYDYENGGIDLDALNGYLKKAGREGLQALPDTYRLFRTVGWICCEDRSVQRVSASGLDYGRRIIEDVDQETAAEVIEGACAYLSGQVRKDGAIPDGPGSGTVDSALQAEAVGALLQGCRLAPSEALAKTVRKAAAYLETQVIYDSQGRGYLLSGDEFTLKGGALAAAALAEYMEVFGTEEQMEVCRALGGGVLAMLDGDKFVHVLNRDFTPGGASRGPGYDGAAVYALCRLYELTGGEEYLNAARSAADRFPAAGYDKYGDPWVALAADKLSRQVPDSAEYYAFSLENAQKNLDAICEQDTTSPHGLETLMAAYQTYDRMTGYGGLAEGFRKDLLLETIRARAGRQLDGFLFPEYAMYMEQPRQVLGAFMTREDGLQIHTGEVCANIRGYYLYAVNYEKLLSAGLLADRS